MTTFKHWKQIAIQPETSCQVKDCVEAWEAERVEINNEREEIEEIEGYYYKQLEQLEKYIDELRREITRLEGSSRMEEPAWHFENEDE